MTPQILFSKKNSYILIGEDHVGGFDFNFNNQDHTKNLIKHLIKNKTRALHLWFEGPDRNAISKSFKAFERKLIDFLRKEELAEVAANIKISGWEIGLTFNRLDEITNFTIGNAEQYYHEKLPRDKNTLFEAIVASSLQGNFRGTLSSPPTKEEFSMALSEGNEPSDILLVLQKKDSNVGNNRVQNIKNLFNDSYSSIRAKYYKGTPGAKTSSQIYKRIDNINRKRDEQLAKVMKSDGGIFLAGSGHVDNIRQMGLL